MQVCFLYDTCYVARDAGSYEPLDISCYTTSSIHMPCQDSIWKEWILSECKEEKRESSYSECEKENEKKRSDLDSERKKEKKKCSDSEEEESSEPDKKKKKISNSEEDSEGNERNEDKKIEIKNVTQEITIILNFEKKTLKFLKNNEIKGELSDINIDKPLYPAVFLYNIDDRIKIEGFC